MKTQKHDAIVLSSQTEKEAQRRFTELLKSVPLPEDELLANLGLFLTSKTLSRILFFHEMYRKIVNTHGIICEFGVRWGQTLSLLSALRGIYEPFNRHRKIVGFDTFAGFRGMAEEDGQPANAGTGRSRSLRAMRPISTKCLASRRPSPISHLKKWDLVKGDCPGDGPAYLRRHPETIISLAVFDFDIYKPTKAALEAIKPHLIKGSVLVFDELCDDIFPGETVALREVFDLNTLRVERLPITARVSYLVIE